MTELEVNVRDKYKVVLQDSLCDIGQTVKNTISSEIVAIVTDTIVQNLYLNTVKQSLEKVGFTVVVKVIKSGEQYKNFETYKEILDFLAENKLTRDDAVLSLGGGVISDLAGFCASTYLRGVSHIIVPTTLLSIIDASIGGKTAIDMQYGKNLVGSFYQPKLVVTSLEVLNSLDYNNLISGLGEGIKYGLLLGENCLKLLEDGLTKDNFSEFVTMCIKCKIDIVVEDEKESGNRKLLNLGHTFGHAIEIKSNFTIPHGVAVALGIDKVLQYSEICENDANRVKSILKKYRIYNYKYNDENLIDFIKMDKKRGKNNTIDLIVLDKIGYCRIKTISIEELNDNNK